MAKPPVCIQRILRVTTAGSSESEDLVATEEPLAIHLGFGPKGGRIRRELAITMRTPGHDLELVLGFLFGEGIVENFHQIRSIRHCAHVEPEHADSLVRVELEEHVHPSPVLLERQTFLNSSCGICGKTSIESLRRLRSSFPPPPLWKMAASVLLQIPSTVCAQQPAFSATGGIHAAALFKPTGELVLLREDIGRHNAVDKLIGNALSHGQLPLSNYLLFLSGRASFELIQKAALAGLALVAAVGAPSSLAIQAAREFGITLAGFLRDARFNLYSHPHRIQLSDSTPQVPP